MRADQAKLYDVDFFEWTCRSAELLRAGRFEQTDIEHIAEEIEDMGKRDLRELNTCMQVLLVHLLKRRFRREKRSPSWERTIAGQRIKLEQVLDDSPSLRPKAEAKLGAHYSQALQLAAIETGIPIGRFPEACPFSVEQILDPDFLP